MFGRLDDKWVSTLMKLTGSTVKSHKQPVFAATAAKAIELHSKPGYRELSVGLDGKDDHRTLDEAQNGHNDDVSAFMSFDWCDSISVPPWLRRPPALSPSVNNIINSTNSNTSNKQE